MCLNGSHKVNQEREGGVRKDNMRKNLPKEK